MELLNNLNSFVSGKGQIKDSKLQEFQEFNKL